MSEMLKIVVGVLVGLAAVFGLAAAVGSSTDSSAHTQTSLVVDTLRLRVDYEKANIIRTVDSGFHAINKRMDNFELGQKRMLEILEGH